MSAADDLSRRIGAIRPEVPSDLGPEEPAYRLGFTAGKLAATSVAIAAVEAIEPADRESYQARVAPWMLACFGEMTEGDREERAHRFLEEALELVQACGSTADEAHQLVDYVYGRATGERAQEVGGVVLTLAALCLAEGLEMAGCAETELARVWTKIDQIRAKQAAKPKHSPLPGPSEPRAAEAE